MKRTPLSFSSFLIVTSLLLPANAHADMAKMMCMNMDALTAEKILAARVIVVATVDAVSSKEGKLRNGGWTYSWNAKVSIKKTLQGTLSGKKITLSGYCSGLPNMSRNHCGVVPSKSEKPTVLFLTKRKKGTYHIVSPDHTGYNSCPGEAEIAKANKKFPGLLDKVKKSQEQLSKAKTALAASKPTGSKPTGSKPTGSKPTGSKPTGSKSTASKSTASTPAASTPAASKPTAKKPAARAKGGCMIVSSGESSWTFFGLLVLLGLLGLRRLRHA